MYEPIRIILSVKYKKMIYAKKYDLGQNVM
jgi:hypothetical protein